MQRARAPLSSHLHSSTRTRCAKAWVLTTATHSPPTVSAQPGRTYSTVDSHRNWPPCLGGRVDEWMNGWEWMSGWKWATGWANESGRVDESGWTNQSGWVDESGRLDEWMRVDEWVRVGEWIRVDEWRTSAEITIATWVDEAWDSVWVNHCFWHKLCIPLKNHRHRRSKFLGGGGKFARIFISLSE